MIDWLKIGKSAHFHRKQRHVPKSAVTALFREIRDDYQKPSNNIFQHIKEPFLQAQWSAISFYYECDPSFLELPDGEQRERVCGYMFFVEYRNFIAIFRSGLELPSAFKTRFLDRAGSERVERAVVPIDATVEKLRLRSMTTSKYALRAKTLEANDLQSVVAPAGASRFLAQGYRVKVGDNHYSATPSTGRISLRSDKAGHEDLVRWCIAEIDRLHNPNPLTSQFITSFARPIDLGSLQPGNVPTYFGVNVADLSEDLFEADQTLQLLKRSAAGYQILARQDTEGLLKVLERDFPISISKGTYLIRDPDNNARIGTIAIGKNRIALKAFDLPEIEDVFIEPENGQPPGNECIPLKRYLDREDRFTVLFSSPSLIYIYGTLYRDDAFADGGKSFLKHIIAHASLNTVTSEKGVFATGQNVFSPSSVFRAVIDNISQGDDVLVCDDLSNEWADFIGINTSSVPRTISFYHAKHDDLSLGASALHIAVGQAMKNLGNMTLPIASMSTKFQFWNSTYNNNQVQTQIARTVRGDAGTIGLKVEDTRSAPDTIRKVYIVASSLSRQRIEQAFAAIRGGGAPKPHFVQLYWLLTTFFASCSEVGANGYIVCRD